MTLPWGWASLSRSRKRAHRRRGAASARSWDREVPLAGFLCELRYGFREGMSICLYTNIFIYIYVYIYRYMHVRGHGSYVQVKPSPGPEHDPRIGPCPALLWPCHPQSLPVVVRGPRIVGTRRLLGRCRLLGVQMVSGRQSFRPHQAPGRGINQQFEESCMPERLARPVAFEYGTSPIYRTSLYSEKENETSKKTYAAN